MCYPISVLDGRLFATSRVRAYVCAHAYLIIWMLYQISFHGCIICGLSEKAWFFCCIQLGALEVMPVNIIALFYIVR